MTVPPNPMVITSDNIPDIMEVSAIKWSYSSRRRKIAIILLSTICALLVASLNVFAVYYIKYNWQSKEKVCTSADCIDTANTFLKVMDRQKDPCTDFYAYACGNFAQEYPISEGYDENSFTTIAQNRIERMVTQILQNPDSVTTSKAFKKARMFYKSCMNTELLDELKFQPLYDLLEKVGLPEFPTEDTELNLGKTLGQMKRYLGIDVLFNLERTEGQLHHKEPNDTYIIEISTDAKLKVSENLTSNDKKIMTEITQLLLDDLQLSDNSTIGNQTEMIAEMLEITEFTINFNKVIDEQSNNTDPESMTFAELETLLGNVSQNDSLGTKKLLKDYVTELFSGETGDWTYDYKNDLISVKNVDVFKNLWAFLDSQKPITIMRYVWWHVILEYAKYTTVEMCELYQTLIGATEEECSRSSRENYCINQVKENYTLAIAKEIRAVFGLGNQTQKVEAMMNNIQVEFEKLVNAADWLDNHTKMINIKKAKSIISFFGYPKMSLDETSLNEYYSNLKLNEREYLLNRMRRNEFEVLNDLKTFRQTIGPILKASDESFDPFQVNADYSNETNTIHVAAGILQKPYYFRGLESLNYGAIGQLLGHEVTHGFDSCNEIYEHESIQKGRAQQSRMDECKQREQCFIDQYSTFNLSKEKRLDGKQTLNENIADNGGLRESYYAYQTFVKKHGKELKLPGFEDFTHEQLLFLSFANSWCEEATDEFYINDLSGDPHSPSRVRVLATLQNMKEFSQAFQCPSGSFMNPAKKCILW